MYTFDFDTTKVDKKLKKLYTKFPKLSRTVMSYVCEAIVSWTQEHHLSGQTLKRKTGTLAKSITYRITGNQSAKVGSNLSYAAIHEFGGEIEPKDPSGYLRFTIADQWITTKKVTIPARPYLSPSIEYVLDNKLDSIFEKKCEEWLDTNWEG